MQSFSFTIKDPNGIHARPAGLFAQKMMEFKSSIVLEREDQKADAKRLLSIMKLRAKFGQTLTLYADGEDENDVINAARAFIASASI